MERQIKMIGIDLDGTLLNTKKELPPYTRRVLSRALKEGVIVLAATGRPYTGVPEEIKNFPGMRYVLTSNGARIVDMKTQKVLYEHLLPLEKAKKALEIFEKYDTLQEVYFDGQGYADSGRLARIEKYHHNPNMWEYVRSSRIAVPDIWEIVREKQKDMDKVQALFADMEERQLAWNELEQMEGIVIVGSLGYNIEVNAEGVDKGTGLMKLGELLGICREEIMACGDADNDVTMLKEAGFGVAVANAEEKVKEAADYITGTNDEEGAAKAIERFALKGE